MLDSLESRTKRGPAHEKERARAKHGSQDKEPMASQERVYDEVLEHARVARRWRARSCKTWRMARRTRSRCLGLRLRVEGNPLG